MRSVTCSELIKQAAAQPTSDFLQTRGADIEAAMNNYQTDPDWHALKYSILRYNDRNRNVAQDIADSIGSTLTRSGAASMLLSAPVVFVYPETGFKMAVGGVGAALAGRFLKGMAQPSKYENLLTQEQKHHRRQRDKAESALMQNQDFLNDVKSQYQLAEDKWRKKYPGDTPDAAVRDAFYWDVDYPGLFKKYNYPKNIPLKTRVPMELRDDYDTYLARLKKTVS